MVWCAVRTCCWEKPLPWWCWYSCYCAWLIRPCTSTWYVNCYKLVCMLFFVHTFTVSCAFIPQACTWKVYTKYQESSQGSASETTVQHLWSCSTVRLWITCHNKSYITLTALHTLCCFISQYFDMFWLIPSHHQGDKLKEIYIYIWVVTLENTTCLCLCAGCRVRYNFCL